jgi:hypothetical protein
LNSWAAPTSIHSLASLMSPSRKQAAMISPILAYTHAERSGGRLH